MSELSPPTRPMVRITRHGPDGYIAELALDRPEAMNAVSTQMAKDLGAACAELSADQSLRVVLVTSTSPTAFCVGADLKERSTFTDADLMASRPWARAAYSGVLNLPVPTIAIVEGFALGGGLEIALSCDLILAGSAAVVGLPEVSVGVIPGGGGTQLLTRRIGWSRAAGMIFTARRMPAREAAALGVVDEVLEPGAARDRGDHGRRRGDQDLRAQRAVLLGSEDHAHQRAGRQHVAEVRPRVRHQVSRRREGRREEADRGGRFLVGERAVHHGR